MHVSWRGIEKNPLLKFEKFIRKGDMILGLCTMRFIPPYAILVQWGLLKQRWILRDLGTELFLKDMHLFVPKTHMPMFRKNLWSNILEQASLLSNKRWHLECMYDAMESKFGKVNNTVFRRDIWDVLVLWRVFRYKWFKMEDLSFCESKD
jgi:hypothetical protein